MLASATVGVSAFTTGGVAHESRPEVAVVGTLSGAGTSGTLAGSASVLPAVSKRGSLRGGGRIVASHVTGRGLATFVVGFAGEDGRVAHHVVTVRRVGAGAGARWVDPLAAEAAAAASGHRTGSLPAAPAQIVRLVQVPRLDAASRREIVARHGAQCVWAQSEDRWATVGTSYPVGKTSRSWLEYGSASASTFGAAVSYGDGWSASGSATLSDAWGQGFAKSRHPRSYRVDVRYRKQHCYLSSGVYGHSHWIPRYETGGTQTYRLSKRPKWRTCRPIWRGPWWRGKTRGSDHKLSTGVKFAGVIGIDLRTQRAYSTDSRLYYDKPKKRRLCGNTQVPAKASKLRERKAA